MNWIQRLRGQKTEKPARQAERKVALVMHDGKIRIVKAVYSQSGYMARWIDNDDTWSLLLAKGKVVGTDLVKGWYPHSGWDGTEKFFEKDAR
jgi:hypothetical protein